MNFSDQVKSTLNHLGVSPAELARKMGYTPQYISDLLSEKRRWNEDTMAKACQALGIKIAFIELERREVSETFTQS
ncbi:MAG TPA: helix-turn-helix transcriptional regulator [Desulfitobacterium dehalogenans]|uniref:Helix-turn-helix transcriptional regulator n=1 Tax=Desulfitobacterium dehalogenans TaxID=36854 RepID=A0A7C7DAI2_9FIRM|nr:helix-turn-helix transcriptional regulator [Desulfitobacterium dehalogenans]